MGYRRTVSIRASVSRLWRAWTEPADLTVWLAPVCHVDLRAGGKWEFFWFDSEEEESTRGCRLLAVEPPRRLEFEWTGGGNNACALFLPPHHPSIVEVRMEEQGDTVNVAVEQRETRPGSPWAAYDEFMAEEWEEALLALKSHAEGGDILPDWGPFTRAIHPPQS